MLTLIKREIEDNIILFVLACIIVIIFAIVTASSTAVSYKRAVPIGIPPIMFMVFTVLAPLGCFASAAMGAAQMYVDRNKKITSFLSTLATTRGQIFTARLATGVLWLVVLVLPLALVDMVLLKAYPQLVPIDVGFLIQIFLAMFLVCLACYSLGLLMGWNTNKFFPVLGSIAATPIIISIVLIKGLGLESSIFLLLVTVALVTRAYQKFMSSSL